VHYQPNATLANRTTSEITELLENSTLTSAGFMVYSWISQNIQHDNLIAMPEDYSDYKQSFYATLHSLDQRVSMIWLESPS
jgi:hypothetical protein